MKIIRTVKYKKAQWGGGRYEDVVFMQGDEAESILVMIEEHGEEAAVDYLSQWHNPGEHETREDVGAGESDYVKRFDEYVLSYNPRIGYVGLCYDTQKEKEKMGTWEIDSPNM